MPKVAKKTIKNTSYDDFLPDCPSPSRKENLQSKQIKSTIKKTGDTFKEKVLQTMKIQFESGKRGNQGLIYSLSTLLNKMEQDFTTIQENGQRNQQLIMAHLKSVKQANSSVMNERVDCLKEILVSFQKQCEEQEINHQNDYNEKKRALGEEMKMLHKKLIADTRREQLNNLHQSISHAFDTKY